MACNCGLSNCLYSGDGFFGAVMRELPVVISFLINWTISSSDRDLLFNPKLDLGYEL